MYMYQNAINVSRKKRMIIIKKTHTHTSKTKLSQTMFGGVMMMIIIIRTCVGFTPEGAEIK